VSKMWKTPFGHKWSDKHFKVGIKAKKLGVEENKGSAFSLEAKRDK